MFALTQHSLVLQKECKKNITDNSFRHIFRAVGPVAQSV